jgi:hypothetical protein
MGSGCLLLYSVVGVVYSLFYLRVLFEIGIQIKGVYQYQLCTLCYADVSNAFTKLLKCCFSRSATLPSTLCC